MNKNLVYLLYPFKFSWFEEICLKQLIFLFFFDLDPPRKLLCKIHFWTGETLIWEGGTAASEDEEEEEKKKHHAEFKLILKTCLVYLLFFEGPSVIKKMAELNNS